ncbi:MAG: GNAT family N-acetyltransferase, partial [Candidatus Hodarchaeota archaeon]
KYKRWYEAQGLDFTHTCLCMESDISELKFKPSKFPLGFKIESLAEISRNEIHKCFFETFKEGSDRFILSLDGEQREDFFDMFFDKTTLNEASYALLKEGKLIGFLVAREAGEAIELGPLGIHPEFQGKGLGKALLGLSLTKIIEQGHKISYLEVDSENHVAYELYRKYGFDTISKKVGYSWMAPKERIRRKI